MFLFYTIYSPVTLQKPLESKKVKIEIINNVAMDTIKTMIISIFALSRKGGIFLCTMLLIFFFCMYYYCNIQRKIIQKKKNIESITKNNVSLLEFLREIILFATLQLILSLFLLHPWKECTLF